MTTNIWSSRVMESYMAETLHYLTQDFEMQNLTIEVTPFRGSHTALNIQNFWEDSFCAFGLSTEKLTMMMRDNVSNDVKACNHWAIWHFGCIGHSIYLVLGLFLIKKHKKNAKASEGAAQDDHVDEIDDENNMHSVSLTIDNISNTL